MGDDPPLGDHHVEKGVNAVDRHCPGLDDDALAIVAFILGRENRPGGDHNPCQHGDAPFHTDALPLHVQSLNGKLQAGSLGGVPGNGIGGFGGEDFLAVGSADGREGLAAQGELHAGHADIILGFGHQFDNLTRIDRKTLGGGLENQFRRLRVHIAFHHDSDLSGGLLSRQVRRQGPDPHRGVRIPERGSEVGLIGGCRIGEERLIVNEEGHIPKGHIVFGLSRDVDGLTALKTGPLGGSSDRKGGRLRIGWDLQEQSA